MVLNKCEKCFQGFRTSKLNEEMCSKCHVRHLPEVTEPGVDEEFAKMAEEYIGTLDENEKSRNLCKDPFNHKARLLSLQEQLRHLRDTKTYQKRSREIGRVMEEHDAVVDRLTELQNQMMTHLLLFQQTKNPSSNQPTPTSPPKSCQDPKQDPPKSPDPPTSHRVHGIGVSTSSSDDNSDKDKHTPPVVVCKSNLSSSGMDKEKRVLQRVNLVPKKKDETSVPELVTTPEEESNTSSTSSSNAHLHQDGEKGDELAPLRRSLSVRNRIKAFEEISRRASTGNADWKVRPRRKLNF